MLTCGPGLAGAVSRPEPMTATAVRQTLEKWIGDLYKDRSQGCALLDRRRQAAFLADTRRVFRATPKTCAAAIAIWSKTIRENDSPLAPELRAVGRAPVTLHGSKAALSYSEAHVEFVYSSGHWLIDDAR